MNNSELIKEYLKNGGTIKKIEKGKSGIIDDIKDDKFIIRIPENFKSPSSLTQSELSAIV